MRQVSNRAPAAPRIKVCHVITGLPTGGAQTMLANLISGSDRERFEMEVISLTETGPVGQRLDEMGVPVAALEMNRALPNPGDLFRLGAWLRRRRPHLVQTWMYHADLVGGLAARLGRAAPVLWNIRHSTLDPAGTKKMTLWTARACARLSRRLPSRIVCCSESSRDVHAALGYAADKMLVIPNGVDLSRFRPEPGAAASVRAQLEVGEATPLIGLVGRFHPQKDHRTFIAAAARLGERFPEARFVLLGEDITWQNGELADWVRGAGLAQKVLLLGLRDDVARLVAAFDVAASSSAFGEGFSNAVVEAMACAVPCAVTDVGDSRFIVGDSGWVVPPRDAEALAAAWAQALEMAPARRRERGQAARERAARHFDLATVVERYQRLYQEQAPSSPA
jgi:glycosyltransferase involved in cell wall biosynthesis